MNDIFVSPGNETHLARITEYLHDNVCGILLHRAVPVAQLLPALQLPRSLHNRIFSFHCLLNPVVERPDEADLFAYQEWLSHVLGDPRAQYLATRSYFNSPFNNTVTIERILMNSIRIVRETEPSCLVSSATPHSIEAWVFAKCFEFLELPIYVLEATPNVFRLWIRRGLDQQDPIAPVAPDPTIPLSVSSQRLLSEQRSKPGETDEQGYDVSRMHMSTVSGSRSNKWWSWSRELSRLRFGRIRSLPLRLLAVLIKRRLYRSYDSVAVSELPEGPFVVFFMHYQPERTSLPEGLSFVQQWITLRMLAWALPKGWSLLIREHPTTWLDPLDISVRTLSLYEDLAALPNTYICPMDMNTFELIDRSRAVATLTGSVGFQGLVRGRPVLAFGVASYRDHPACFPVTGYDDLVQAFAQIDAEGIQEQLSDDVTDDYMRWVEANSVSVDPEEQNRLEARLKNFAEIYRQILCGELLLD